MRRQTVSALCGGGKSRPVLSGDLVEPESGRLTFNSAPLFCEPRSWFGRPANRFAAARVQPARFEFSARRRPQLTLEPEPELEPDSGEPHRLGSAASGRPSGLEGRPLVVWSARWKNLIHSSDQFNSIARTAAGFKSRWFESELASRLSAVGHKSWPSCARAPICSSKMQPQICCRWSAEQKRARQLASAGRDTWAPPKRPEATRSNPKRPEVTRRAPARCRGQSICICIVARCDKANELNA